MTTENYHVFGVGLGTDDLRYIGWTQRSVDHEEEQIVSDFVKGGEGGIAHSVCEATDAARISIFELESVPSIKDAMNSASCWCAYFNSLGLHVTCADSCDSK